MPAKKILLGVAAIILVALAIWFAIGLSDENPPPELPKPVKKIQVYLSGQVKNISVVELEDNGNLRVIDAVNLAGGLTDLADTDSINLAAQISDGQHIHIPTKEIFLSTNQNVSSISNDGDKVNINTADLDKLTTLKGVGASTAQKIIDYREQNGKFKSIDELKNVRGIGDKKFDAIKDKITI